jgi:tetratricopeptide (TPR) repeat protein
LKQSKLRDAMTALNEAIQRDSNYAPAYTYRGKAYELQGDYANGIRDYQHALAIDPANQEARDSLRHLGR